MIREKDIDASATERPWADTDPKWNRKFIDNMADELDDVDPDTMANTLKRDAWLEQQDVVTTLLVGCEHVVGIDEDTRLDHNLHVYTSFTASPSEVGMADGLDGIIGYHTIRHRVDTDTDYRITNTRLLEVDGVNRLVLTLAPEADTDTSSPQTASQ